MENEEKLMTPDEGLRIITEMINRSKVDISHGSFHLLFWGWLIFACSISEFLLDKFTSFASPWYVWFLVIPGVFVSMLYGCITGRRLKVITYATMIYVWTWMAFLIAAVILYIINAKNMDAFDSLILVLAGMPTFISGIILKFRPLVTGGITFWIFALVAHFAGPDISSLSVPAAMLTGYLIPGYMLKKKACHDKV